MTTTAIPPVASPNQIGHRITSLSDLKVGDVIVQVHDYYPKRTICRVVSLPEGGRYGQWTKPLVLMNVEYGQTFEQSVLSVFWHRFVR